MKLNYFTFNYSQVQVQNQNTLLSRGMKPVLTNLPSIRNLEIIKNNSFYHQENGFF